MLVIKVILAVLGMMIFWGGFYSLTQHKNDEINQKIDKITMAVGAVIEILVLIWLFV